jgi:hypothetical protein
VFWVLLKFVLKILNVAFVCAQVEFAMSFKNRREVEPNGLGSLRVKLGSKGSGLV